MSSMYYDMDRIMLWDVNSESFDGIEQTADTITWIDTLVIKQRNQGKYFPIWIPREDITLAHFLHENGKDEELKNELAIWLDSLKEN